MQVEALSRISVGGVPRVARDRFELSRTLALHLRERGLVRIVTAREMEKEDWWTFPHRELRAYEGRARPWRRVVACVNIWNDLAALRQTMPSWLPYVDRVVVVDGAYAALGLEQAESTDGLAAWLAEQVAPERLELILPPAGGWPNQCAKRSAYCAAGEEGDLLFIVDADERVAQASALREVSECDVGWVRLVNETIYRRPYGQPRLVRWRPGLAYRGRHHWMFASEAVLATHQYGGPGFWHRLVPLTLTNTRRLGRSPERVEQQQRSLAVAAAVEHPLVLSERTRASDSQLGARESLRILQLASYDPGLVGYRLHTAINTTTPHASVFARKATDNPFRGPYQVDLLAEQERMAALLQAADVVHCHLDYGMLRLLRATPQRVVIHHHGTLFRKMSDWFNLADPTLARLRLISNFELRRYGDGLRWLPNPIPVAEYRALRALYFHPSAGVRIGHSPSKRELKGTETFLAAVETMRQAGLAVEPVLIENQPHGEALRIKASCDLFFDSFDLGLQCSGLEAGAMGIPVLAGDEYVRAEYEREVGSVPYVFVTPETLVDAMIDLAQHEEERERAAARLASYVTEYHDEAAVALRYLDLLDEAFRWRQEQRVDTPQRLMVERRRAV